MADETTSIWSDMWEKAKGAFSAMKDWPKTVSFMSGFIIALILKALV